MGEDSGCKSASTVCGELSFHRLSAKEEQHKEWIVKIRRKNTPTYTKHLFVVPTLMEEMSRYFFRFCKICVDYACEKRAVESRQPGCKIP